MIDGMSKSTEILKDYLLRMVANGFRVRKNNKIERLKGTMRERTKVLRGLGNTLSVGRQMTIYNPSQSRMFGERFG
jgi:hypothetical protein